MNEETIVAVFDTAAHAEAAVRDLESAGVPSSAISQHAASSTGSMGGSTSGGSLGGSSLTGASTTKREPGFWQSLFGGEPDYDAAVYDRSLESGSTVVTVRTSGAHIETATSILERHNPIDIDDRAASYGLSSTTSAGLGATTSATTTTTNTATTGGLRGVGEEVLALSEETLAVGKRLVNQGTTRIRRFVVETPVEENVTLHSERVVVERRPVTGDARVGDTGFTDKVIEVTETAEEAVVGKAARVREEVVVRKEGADRVETVHDTVRREDVEITKDAGLETTKAGYGSTTGVTGTSTTGTRGLV